MQLIIQTLHQTQQKEILTITKIMELLQEIIKTMQLIILILFLIQQEETLIM